MAKSFKIQMNPTFKSVVDVPRVGGEDMRITFTFKAFDRVRLARVFDEWKEEGAKLLKEMREATDSGAPWTMEELAIREIKMQVKQVKQVVDGWGFDDEFNDENIEILVSSGVSVTDAIIEQYSEGYNRAKKGN